MIKTILVAVLLSGCATFPVDESGVDHIYLPEGSVRELCPPETWNDPTVPCYLEKALGEPSVLPLPISHNKVDYVICIEGDSMGCQETVCNVNAVGPYEELTDACRIFVPWNNHVLDGCSGMNDCLARAHNWNANLRR